MTMMETIHAIRKPIFTGTTNIRTRKIIGMMIMEAIPPAIRRGYTRRNAWDLFRIRSLYPALSKRFCSMLDILNLEFVRLFFSAINRSVSPRRLSNKALRFSIYGRT